MRNQKDLKTASALRKNVKSFYLKKLLTMAQAFEKKQNKKGGYGGSEFKKEVSRVEKRLRGEGKFSIVALRHHLAVLHMDKFGALEGIDRLEKFKNSIRLVTREVEGETSIITHKEKEGKIIPVTIDIGPFAILEPRARDVETKNIKRG